MSSTPPPPPGSPPPPEGSPPPPEGSPPPTPGYQPPPTQGYQQQQPPPPPGYGLPAPGYPGTAGGGGHKLGAGVIAAIIAAVLVIAGGATAAILLIGNSSNHAQQPVNSGALIGPSSQTPSPSASSSPSTTPSPTTTTSPGGGIPLGSHGVSLTPAPGWTIHSQQSNSVSVLSGDGAGIFVTVGPASSMNITQVLSADMQTMIGGNAVQVGPMSTPSTYAGQNFNLRVSASYQGTRSSQQSTYPIFGVCFELLNTSTGQSAYIDYFSVDSVTPLSDHAAEATRMISSLG